ncbi:hypothetical protein HED60_06735 [Planctomycetales bacterium ZRK34]|nr:hypothetical protein HED60_06735 [Planctomycetales bacterium ZRK34]
MNLDVWQSLLEPSAAELLEAAAACDDFTSPSTITRLRKLGDDEQVRAAIELTIARRKAADKFDHPEQMIADPVGVEQATSLDVARHKAKRFAEAGIDHVVDLCCGIGGDAIALREHMSVKCIDRDPVRAWMAQHNTGCPAECADVTTLAREGAAYHIDPDRRPGGRRVWCIDDCEPGPEFLHTLNGDGAMKLSPAVDFEQLQGFPGGEVEIINRRGTLVQAVLWTGRLARHERTATRIDCDTAAPGCAEAISMHGSPRYVPLCEPQRYLLAIDPAIERADLTGELCDQLDLAAIHPALGLLTSDTPVQSPWLTGFELLATLPWHEKNLKKIKAALREHDAGLVDVKTRGKAVDPDRFSPKLRQKGNQHLTVFVLRMDQKHTAFITRRL